MDPIVQEFIAEAERYIGPVKDMRTAALQAAKANDALVESCVRLDDVLDDVGISAGAAAREMNDLRNAVGETAAVDSRLAGETNDLRDALAESAGAASALAGRMNDLRDAVAGNTGAVAALANRVNDLRDSFITAAAAAKLLGDRSALSGGEAAVAASRFRLLGTGIRLTGTAIHWLIAGTAEFLAVFIPATVAVGAWAFAWVQGATNIYQHMTSLFDATEALGQSAGHTMGEMLGLNGAWQKIQNEANPDVYAAMGAGLNILKESFGNLAEEGLRVGQIFDRFAARLVYDFSAAGGAGKTMTGLLSDMTPDLVEIGQVFGNLGHALMNFAGDMPGLAEGLLLFADAVSKVILWVSKLPRYLVMGFMAFEEFNRWGSVAINVLGRFGLATSEVGGSFFGIFRSFGILRNLIYAPLMLLPKLIQGFGGLLRAVSPAGSAINRLGVNIGGLGSDAEDAVAGLSMFQAAAITLGILGIGFLIYKIATFRSAAQQLTASMQQAVEKANDLSILRDVGANLSVLAQKESQATGTMHQLASATNDGSYALGSFSRFANAQQIALQGQSAAYRQATSDASAYRSGQVQQIRDAAQTVKGAQQISSMYGVSVPAAMAIAQGAGVNLTNALKNQKGQWTQAGEQVRDYMAGLHAMGASTGMVGHDMLAMAIQTGVAGTKMQQVSQAFDQFMQDVTGGTGGLAGFETSIEQIGQVVGKVSNNLSNSTGSMSLSTKQFADALTTFTGKGASAWQNFTQIVGSTAPQLVDWFRTALTEGAIKAPQFNKAVLDMSSQMLGFAKDSKPAQAELVAFAQNAGLNIRTFPQLEKAIKDSGASVGNLGKITSDTTIAMGNMSKIAQNLGDVMNSQVTSAISNAALKTSGFYADVAALTADMQKYGAGSPQAVAAANKVTEAFDRAQRMAALVGRNALQSQRDIDALHGKDIDIRYYTSGAGQSGLGFPGGGPGGHGGPGNSVIVHVHGSVSSSQDLVREITAGVNRATFRNSGNQLYKPGRLH